MKRETSEISIYKVTAVRQLCIWALLLSSVMLTGQFAVAAEETKPIAGPSLDETKSFITSFFRDYNDMHCNGHHYRYISVYMEGSLIKVLYRFDGDDVVGTRIVALPSEVKTFEIDMRKVEEIRVIGSRSGFEGGCRIFGVQFVEKGGSKKAELHLPIWKFGFSSGFDEAKNTQIYKSFNHLRKLSGAPEAVRFE